MRRRVILENNPAIALDLNEWISGENVVREQSGAAFVRHGEPKQPVVGRRPVRQERARQLPVERRVEELAHADHDVAADVGHDAQVVRHVQLRLPRFELQLLVAWKSQLISRSSSSRAQ